MRNPGVATPAFVMPNNRRTLHVGIVPGSPIVRKQCQSRQRLKIGVASKMVSEASDRAVRKEDAVRHQTKVASHTAVPLGTAKWLGRATSTPGTLPVGKGQGLLMSPTVKAGCYLYCTSYQPFRKT